MTWVISAIPPNPVACASRGFATADILGARLTQGPVFALPEPGAPTTLQVSNTAYGGTTYLDFSSPSGSDNGVDFAFGYPVAAVSAFGFELGTLASDGKRVDSQLGYVHVKDPADYFYTSFTLTPTGDSEFVGFVGNPNVEIAGVILYEESTRHAGTALDLLDVYSTAPLPEPGAWALMLLGAGL